VSVLKDPETEQTLGILFVTRESHLDSRYGLGKSLSPVFCCLEKSADKVRYLSQAHLSPRNQSMISRLIRLLVPIVSMIPSKSIRVCCSGLTIGILERLNMGRLAVKVAVRDGFSHIHAHDPIIAAGALYFRFGRKLSIGVTQHGFGSYSQAIHEDGVPMPTSVMKWMRNWEKRILRRCHWVIMPSKIGLEQLARDLGEYPVPSHWSVINHPLPLIQKLPKKRARQELGLDPTIFYILAVGRIVPLKDFETLIRAVSQIKTELNWALVILGDGDDKGLKNTAKCCGLNESQLIFSVTDNIGVWYSAVDLYVSTSLTESFGMANHEAVCSGVPSILTAVGAVPEVDGSASLLVPKRNVDAISEAIEDLMGNPQLRNDLSQRGAVLSANWPTLDEITDQYLACYKGSRITK